MPYSAGTIVLQVVPSYLGFQEKNAEMAKGMSAALEDGLDKGTERGARKAARNIDKILGEETGKSADKAGDKAADKYVGAFRSKLTSAIKSMEKEIAPIEIRTASGKTLDEVARIKASLKELSETKIEPGMDTGKIRAKVIETRAMLEKMGENLEIEVKGDFDAAIKSAKSFEKYVDSLHPTVEVQVDIPVAKIERNLGALEQMIKKSLDRATSKFGDSMDREISQLKARMAALGSKSIGIDISADAALAELRRIEVEIAHVAATTVDVQVHADAAEALTELKIVDTAMRKLNGQEARLHVKSEGTEKATAKLSILDRLLKKVGIDGRDVANSFRFFSFAVLAITAAGAALIPIIATLSAGVAGLSVAALGAAAGLGVLFLAFSGIGNAVKALNDAQDNAAKESQQSAKRMKQASRSVEDAQKSLRRARENAAQSAEDNERAVARASEDAAKRNVDATRRVVDAKKAAAEAIESALRQQGDAEDRLADSQKASRQAQLDLTQARIDAQKALDDIAHQQRQNALDERQAVIDLFNATVENTAAKQDPGSTNLEREQADINLKSAQLRLEEIRQKAKDLADEQKKGVNGSTQVKTAQERLTQALKDQKQAQLDLGDADKNVTKTRLENAQNITDAINDQKQAALDGQQSVADAIRNRDRAEQDSRDAIASAQENLQQAQEDYRDALDESSTSAQKVAEEMAKLGPAGQAFALFIHSLRDDFQEIRDIVQEAFLPALTDAMKTLQKTYGPGLKKFVGDMATLMGQLVTLSVQVFTSPEWKAFFATIARIAPIVTTNFGKAFLNFLTVFANLAVILAPLAIKISEVFVDFSQAVLDWSRSPEGHKAIEDFLAYVKEVAPDVKEFLKALVLAFIAIVKAVAPFADDILKALTDFLNFIAHMDPKKLGLIVLGLLGMVATFQALSGVISLVSVVAGSGLGAVAFAAFALVGAILYLYNTSEDFHQLVDRIMPLIKDAVEIAFQVWKWNMDQVATAINTVVTALMWLWDNVLDPFTSTTKGTVTDWHDAVAPLLSDIASLFRDIGSDLKYVWEKILWPIIKAFGTVIYDLYLFFFSPAINSMIDVFGDLGTNITNIWKKIVKPVFDAIGHALGLDDQGKESGFGVVGAFRSAVGLIKSIWDGLGDIAKKPVEFMVNTVINKGLIGSFNALVGHLPGLKKIKPLPAFANGGIPDSTYGVRFGYSPGRDNQVVAVGGGEAILRPEATRALGSDWVNAINKRAKLFGVQGVANYMMGFREGGEVSTNGRRSTVDDFARTSWRGHSFNYRTIRMLQAAERIFGHMIDITQGSYSTSVAASGSTHAGGGAFDAHDPRGALGRALVAALRTVGFAAWERDPSQGPWPYHIHGIAIGDPTASASAQRQVQDYFAGGDGLGGKDNGPNVGKDKSLLGKLLAGAGGLIDWVSDAVSNPVDWLKGKVTDKLQSLTDQWGDNSLTQAVKAVPQAIIEGMGQLITGGLGLFGKDDGSAPKGEGPLKNMVNALATSAFGWTGFNLTALDKIVKDESGWNPAAQNPTSSAFGLFQFLDGTWGPYGAKTSDPRLQAQYGLQYIKDRYGDPEHALAFRETHGWYSDGGTVPDNGTMMYDNGGFLPPGITQVVNLTGKPEPVFTADQFEGLRRPTQNAGITYAPTFHESDLTAADVAQDLNFTLRRISQGVVTG